MQILSQFRASGAIKLFAIASALLTAALLCGQAAAQQAAQSPASQPVMQQAAAGANRAPPSQGVVLPSTAAEGYRLGSGDRVRVTVFGQPELTGEFAVDGGGQMSYPLIGQLRAGGLTAAELEKALIGKLSPDYLKNPSVSVEVLTYRPFYIVGEVRTPGSYPFVSGMTVLNAVALAGGFTYRARESSFYVTRTAEDGSKTKLDTGADATILPGDIITVRERYF
ncbi:MAG: polysaccharide export protein [Ferrovibrio sp.]|uniref:polysaccharide biosynthesis/export family protein n=1 Tax=Ferrovibrio sp. TaxID=1917215 RepID=UPI0026226277|nr:polysaccharide biosynthesis/export family protein [Ferrovibrio sp.]MCW0235867.1 polysaccharide export protein [Ferrovibrio sp.]